MSGTRRVNVSQRNMLLESRDTAARTRPAVGRVSAQSKKMSVAQLAGAVDRLVEITESMQSRMESIERRLQVLSGEAPEGFTFEEIARLLKCSRKTVERRVGSGEWGHFLVGKGDKRIPKSELVRITVARFVTPESTKRRLPRGLIPPNAGASEAAKIRAANRKRR